MRHRNFKGTALPSSSLSSQWSGTHHAHMCAFTSIQKKESSSETATTTKKARGDDFSLFSLLFFRSLTKVTPLVLLVLCISLPLSVMCVCVRARVPFLPFCALRWVGRRRSFFIVISFTTQACCASHSAVASLYLSLVVHALLLKLFFFCLFRCSLFLFCVLCGSSLSVFLVQLSSTFVMILSLYTLAERYRTELGLALHPSISAEALLFECLSSFSFFFLLIFTSHVACC